MEEALLALIKNDSGISGLIGNRAYWLRRPQRVSTLPAIRLTKITAPRDYKLDGASGLVFARVQVDCLGKSYKSAKLVARALNSALSGYSSGVFQLISIDGERDQNGKESSAERHLFMTSLDLQITYSE